MSLDEECGLFGVYGGQNVSWDISLGLHAQQHRGQESAGMIVGETSGGEFSRHRDLGLVKDVFDRSTLESLRGNHGIGHVRYSTAGGSNRTNAQPLLVTHRDELYAIAHNGNLTNAASLKKTLERKGTVFRTTSDTEVILHRIVRARGSGLVERIVNALEEVEGAYSLLILSGEGIAAVRDPNGFRPLFLARGEEGIYFSSETCGFDIVDASDPVEIKPGEGYFVSENGSEHFSLNSSAEPTYCSFEAIYFSRPDSTYRDQSIHSLRVKTGRALWETRPVEADLVTNVPDSSNSATQGFSEASGLPYDITLIRSHYTGRTFIAPNQSSRDRKVKQKFNIVSDVVEDRRVVVVDDSIVRGTTARSIARMFRDSGAREVHFRIASPPIRFPCYYGIDMPSREELLVNRVPPEELAAHLEVDSVAFLPVESLREIVGNETCRACFTGQYPTEVHEGDGRITKRKQRPSSEEGVRDRVHV